MNLIAIDTETGGTRSGRHALLSIGAVVSWDTINTTFLRHLLPADGYTIEPEAARINGYTPELWSQRGAIPLDHAMSDLSHFLADAFRDRPQARLLAHNAGFDRAFLDEASVICGILLPIRHAWRCSMDKLGTLMDRGLIPEGKAKLDRLGELSGQWDPGQRQPVHDALHDALACLRGYQWLLRKEKEAEDTLRNLYNASLSERRRLEDLFVKSAEWLKTHSIEGTTLPNDEPLIPRLAFPTGQRVLVGPLDYGGMNGVVDWAADTPMPGGRYMPEERMTESYSGTVPVRIRCTIAFISTRWLMTLP